MEHAYSISFNKIIVKLNYYYYSYYLPFLLKNKTVFTFVKSSMQIFFFNLIFSVQLNIKK